MYWILAVSVLLATGNNAALHTLSGKKYDGFLFNAVVAAVWAVVLGAFAARGFSCDGSTLAYAAAYGVTLAGFIFFKSTAMSNGPVSLTALIGCSSFLLTTAFNALYWKERIGAFEGAGLACMIAAVLFVTYKKDGAQKRANGKWFLSALGFFLFSGATGILFRFHQHADKAHSDEMMTIAAAVAAGLMFVLYMGTRKRSDGAFENARFPIKTAVCCGLFACGYNRLNLYLSGAMASKLFFPLFNGGAVLGSFFVGWLCFKEKPTKLQLCGVALGVLAMLFISKFFGLVE